ncbi:hypothetical protein ACQY0O_000946 [Thecaphora frezii]
MPPPLDPRLLRLAYYHTTTHELLVVFRGTATILLGGRDPRAKPPPPSTTQTERQLHLEAGHVLLIPAGYSHRALHSSDDFTMLGCYPRGAADWNMRYPNVNGCKYDVDEIAHLVETAEAKALFHAQDPARGLGRERGEGVLQETWFPSNAA